MLWIAKLKGRANMSDSKQTAHSRETAADVLAELDRALNSGRNMATGLGISQKPKEPEAKSRVVIGVGGDKGDTS